MVIFNLNHFKVISDEDLIKGGLASANVLVLSSATGEYFAEANTTAITSASLLFGFNNVSVSFGTASSKAM